MRQINLDLVNEKIQQSITQNVKEQISRKANYEVYKQYNQIPNKK